MGIRKKVVELKKNCFTFALFLVLATPLYLHAHPGRVDSRGGHTDRRTGSYHYHSQAIPTPVKSTPSSPSSEGKRTKTPSVSRIGKWEVHGTRGRINAVLNNDRGILALSSSGMGFNVVIGLMSGFARSENSRPVFVKYKTGKIEKIEKWDILSGHLCPSKENAEEFLRTLRGQRFVTLAIQDENEPEQVISFELSEIDKIIDLLEKNYKAERDK